MGKQSIRFAVTDGSGRRATTWICFTHTGREKSDIYLTCPELRGALKVSLHQPDSWRIAYSREFFDENIDESEEKALDDRLIDECSRPSEIECGVTLASKIITPYSAVDMPIDPSEKEFISIPKPPDGRAVEIDLLITSPSTLVSGWPCKNSMNTNLVGSLSLDNGETVWVVYRFTDIPNFGNLHGKPRYFKGKNKDALVGKNLRSLIYGKDEDGSICLVDCKVENYGIQWTTNRLF